MTTPPIRRIAPLTGVARPAQAVVHPFARHNVTATPSTIARAQGRVRQQARMTSPRPENVTSTPRPNVGMPTRPVTRIEQIQQEITAMRRDFEAQFAKLFALLSSDASIPDFETLDAAPEVDASAAVDEAVAAAPPTIVATDKTGNVAPVSDARGE